MVIDGEVRRTGQVEELLQPHGYETASARHGVEAVRHMQRSLPDVILVDQDVQMGGVQTAKVLRLNPRYGRIPILLAAQEQGDARLRDLVGQAQKVGIAGVVMRPYDGAALVEKVKACAPEPGNTPPVEKKAPLTKQERQRRKLNVSVQVRRRIQELTDLPTLSSAQQRIIEIMSCEDEEVNIDELVRAIQADQALTIRTMRIARSAYYGFTGDFVKSAITFLGMSTMRQIVQSATVLEVFDGEPAGSGSGLDRRGFWKHSVACGLVMQRLSRDSKHTRHFTAGMLHDVGKLVLDYRFHDLSAALVEIAHERRKPMQDIEREVIGMTHAEIGQELCRLWQLPAEIGESIAHHHAPSGAYRHKYLSSLVCAADVVVRQMEIGKSSNYSASEIQDTYATKLSLDLEQIAADRETIAAEVDSIVAAGGSA